MVARALASCLLLVVVMSASPSRRAPEKLHEDHRHGVQKVLEDVQSDVEAGDIDNESAAADRDQSPIPTTKINQAQRHESKQPKSLQPHHSATHHATRGQGAHHPINMASNLKQVKQGLDHLKTRLSNSKITQTIKAGDRKLLADLEENIDKFAHDKTHRDQIRSQVQSELPKLHKLIASLDAAPASKNNNKINTKINNKMNTTKVGAAHASQPIWKQRVSQENVPELVKAVDLIKHMTEHLSGRLSDQDQENLAAVGDDLELLSHSDDVQANSDLVKAIALRMPAIQKLADTYGIAGKGDSERHANTDEDKAIVEDGAHDTSKQQQQQQQQDKEYENDDEKGAEEEEVQDKEVKQHTADSIHHQQQQKQKQKFSTASHQTATQTNKAPKVAQLSVHNKATAPPPPPASHTDSQRSTPSTLVGATALDQARRAVLASHLSAVNKDKYVKALEGMRDAIQAVEGHREGVEGDSKAVGMEGLMDGVSVLRAMQRDMEEAALRVGERGVVESESGGEGVKETHPVVAADEDDESTPPVAAKAHVWGPTMTRDNNTPTTTTTGHGKTVDVTAVAANGLEKIQTLRGVVDASNIPADKKQKFLSNLQGLERDTRALRDPKLTEAQKMDLESAMKLRVTMLKDMEQFLSDVAPSK